MSEKDVDDAIKKLKAFLDKPMSPREAKILSDYEQYGAILRDMTPEEWEEAVSASVRNTDLPEAEVRNWFGRLSGKCAENNATWTEG